MKQTLGRHWPLVVVVALAILLRLTLLNGSFWMDEAAQALQSARPWSEQLQIRDDFQPPLLHLIVAVAIRVDDSEWLLRTWGALIPGILTIVGTYFVALEVGHWVFKQKSVKLQDSDNHRQKPVEKINAKLVIQQPKVVMLDLPAPKQAGIQHLKIYFSIFDQSILLATLTALLLATSSFHIFYSQELRPYSLPAMWGIWSWWMLIKMTAINIGRRSWWGWSMGWVVLSTLGLYSSYLYPFLLISQIVWIAMTFFHHPKLICESEVTLNSSQCRRRKSDDTFSASNMQSGNSLLSRLCPMLHWLALGLVIILAFLPWLPSFIDQLNAGQMLRLSLPGWEAVVSTPQLKALALVGGKFLFGVTDITPNLYFAIYSLIFFGSVAICVYWLWQTIKHQSILNPTDRHAEFVSASSKQIDVFKLGLSIAILLILIAFFVPLITAWLVSFIVPVLQPKRVLYLLPFWYLGLSLLITIVITNYQSWRVRFWTIALLSLLLVFNLGSTIAYWLDPSLQRENWRQAWQEINQTYGDQTPKLFLFDGPFASWQWYDQQLTNYALINEFSFTGVRTADSMQARSIVQKATNHYTQPTILYFDYLTDLTDPDRLVLTELAKRGYQPAEVLDYPNIGFVRVFRK